MNKPVLQGYCKHPYCLSCVCFLGKMRCRGIKLVAPSGDCRSNVKQQHTYWLVGVPDLNLSPPPLLISSQNILLRWMHKQSSQIFHIYIDLQMRATYVGEQALNVGLCYIL